ncbi:DUF3558 domain-containing protein [Streptomyces sp. ALI-76-A]|uniref:DUF3558 domain-containing protein n=1 Tax=Streptomyces sp. ALI-76-A TaxID=3025736 RepID=UPI00256F5143|nr:DUF3558 domain-containing protein [Streptomyces sp. ALI-76-A]MDL5203061.1 DUF3558 domain-containing protein [Streptomyces sp. ALI-76-A]
MQRKAYVPGVAALLAALLVGCTGGSGDDDTTDHANPDDAGTASVAAEPGRYRTLPEPCGAVGQDTLDSLLPGIRQITDEAQREKAYAGEATPTFDTDRKVGCRWKVESTNATDHLLVDFERVVSYDTSVSDDSQAQQLFATTEEAADLPEPVSPSAVSDVGSGEASPDESAAGSGSPTASPTDAASASSSPSSSAASSASSSSSPTSSTSATPADLAPRLLDGLGDEAFLDDALSSSGSTAQQRTVTVAFRTSNVIVTIEYAEQPATLGVAPDSKEMQDKARNLAAQLAESLAG